MQSSTTCTTLFVCSTIPAWEHALYLSYPHGFSGAQLAVYWAVVQDSIIGCAMGVTILGLWYGCAMGVLVGLFVV